MNSKEIKKKNQKDYMKNEYAKMWTQMRKKEYQYDFYDKFLINLVEKSINKSKKKKILEICCGDGNPFAKRLITKYNYFGIDISKHLINIAKKKYGQDKFKIGDVEKINLKEKFDLIICFHSLWYLPGYLNSIKKMSKNLKPQGFMIFDALNKDNPINIDDYKKIVSETRGLGKIKRLFKNIIKIIFRVGYAKWSNVIHHKLNDIQKINHIIKNKSKFKQVYLYGLIPEKKKLFRINHANSKQINAYSKIIFKCKK